MSLRAIFRVIWAVVLTAGTAVILFGIAVQADASFPTLPYAPVCRADGANAGLTPLRPEAVAVALDMMRAARISARERDGELRLSRLDLFGRMGEAPRAEWLREAEPAMAQHVLRGGVPGGQGFPPPPALLRFARRQNAIQKGQAPEEDGPPLAWPTGPCAFMRAALTPFEAAR